MVLDRAGDEDDPEDETSPSLAEETRDLSPDRPRVITPPSEQRPRQSYQSKPVAVALYLMYQMIMPDCIDIRCKGSNHFIAMSNDDLWPNTVKKKIKQLCRSPFSG